MKNRKIDIHVAGAYRCSTMKSRTLKEAKARFLAAWPLMEPSVVRCVFSERIGPQIQKRRSP